MTAGAPTLWLVTSGGGYSRRLAAALWKRGWHVSHLVAAEAVIPKLNYSVPDVFVIRVAQPAMRIAELARWIRKATPGREIPILGLEGSWREEREAEAAGCDSIVRIPWSAGALAREVDVRARLELAVRQSRSGVGTHHPVTARGGASGSVR